jgi:hypothetical protein
MIGKRLLGAIVVLWLALSPLSVQPASAVFITGKFDLTLAAADVDLGANTIEFVPGATIFLGTGDFAALNGTVVTFFGEGVPPPIDYTNLAGLGAPLFSGGGMTFTVTGNSATETADPSLILSGTGIFTFGAFDPTEGRFIISTQNVAGGTGVVSYSANFVAVPGPVVGAGIPGLIAACGAMVILARRRRKFA